MSALTKINFDFFYFVDTINTLLLQDLVAFLKSRSSMRAFYVYHLYIYL